MLRIVIYVAALVCLFGGAIVYGGNAIGAWDPLPPAPQPPPALKIVRTKPKPKPPTTTQSVKSPAAAPRLTPAQKAWVKQADALCRQSKVEVQRVVSQGDATTSAGVIALFARVKNLNARLNHRFLALGAPAGYRNDIARVRALFAKEERYFDSMYAALKRQDQNTYYGLSDRLTEIALDESDILANLGAYDCDVSLLPSLS
jgi:hypothetical protein